MNSINELHKNPMFYYILVPVVAVVWPSLLYFQSLPEAQKDLAKEKQFVEDVNTLVPQILALDPMRMRDPKAKDSGSRTFAYTTEVDRVAKACGIRSFKVRPVKPVKNKQTGRNTQTANVSLKDVDLVRTTIFISTLLGDWTDLECTKISMSLPNKTETDIWKVDLSFHYTF